MTLLPRTVSTAGAEIATWHRAGEDDGPWMVMLHGAGVDHREFLDLLPFVDAEWNILLLDTRGHGGSQLAPGAAATLDTAIDDLSEVLAALGIPECVLVGHSFGGNIAQEFTHLHPERVRALVTIGSPGQHRTLRRRELAAMRLAARVSRRVPWGWFADFSGRWSSRVPATRAYVSGCLRATGRTTYISLSLSGFGSVHPAPESTIPTLLVRGAHDMPRALDAVFTSLARHNPELRTTIVGDAGHQVMQDNPDELGVALSRFLEAVHER